MPLFLKIYLLYFGVLYLSCFLTGCLLVRKSWPLEYKLLVVLSGLTLLIEAIIAINMAHRLDTRWIYNFFSPVECGFILYILYRASMHPTIKRLNGLLLVLLPISIAISFYQHPGIFTFNESASLFYDFLELIASCSFLVGVLLNKSDVSPGRLPLFWMACGMVFYCSIFTLQNAVADYIARSSYPYFVLYSYVANTFMYAGFIACFVCLRRINRGASPA